VNAPNTVDWSRRRWAKTEKGFKNGLEAFEAFADLFESEEEMDQFVAAVHEWRG
jgi:hypothetical protein